MSHINLKNGLLRLWVFAIMSIAVFTFICELTGYNFYWLLPMPFSDLCVHLYNYLQYSLEINDPIGLATITALSNVVVIGFSLMLIGYGLTWVRKGFTNI